MTAVYLLAAVQSSPAYFLGPLGALLLLSHPRTPREWFWIVVCAGALVAWLRLPASLAETTVRASAAFFAGAFVMLTLVGMRSLFSRTFLAVVVATVATAAWYLVFHLRFAAMQHEMITQTWEAWRLVLPYLPATMPAGAGDLATLATADRAGQAATFITVNAALFPASLALTALFGARLSWSWYHRIARTPLLPPARPFRDFRFNDQLIWLLVIALAALLVSPSGDISLVAWNFLTVVAVLYAARGAAILRTSLRRASPLFVGVLVLMMLALVTVIPVGLALLGVADTWVDFRRRMAPPPGVPS